MSLGSGDGVTGLVPGGGSIAAGDITDAGAAGVSLVQTATMAAARAALAPVTTYTFTAADGWTTDNGDVGGTAAIASGRISLTVPDATAAYFIAGAGYHAPSASRAIPAIDGRVPARWRVRARLRAIATGAGAITYFWLDRTGGGARWGALIRGSDGALWITDLTGGSNTAGAGTIATDGTGWIELEWTGAALVLRYGTGVGTAEPTSWTESLRSSGPAAAAWWSTIGFAGAADPAATGATVTEWDDCTVEAL